MARVIRSSGGLTIAGQLIGTANYGAPEQINGTAVDGQADQYALACVTYELLTGSVPFKREDPTMVPSVRVHQPASELSRVALHDDLLPLSQFDPAQMLLARPVLREKARPVP